MISAHQDPATRASELTSLQQEFPGFRIWWEVTGKHARLVAVRRNLGTKPHTVVTADVEELRAALDDHMQARKPMTRRHAPHRG